MHVEELDERAHEESGDYGSDSCNSWDLRRSPAGQEKQYATQDYAYQVGDDPDILELAFFPGVDDDKGHSVISGYTKVRGHVEG